MESYNTKYGKITIYRNERYIGLSFFLGRYWDEEAMLLVKDYIDPTRNILEIGGHCGTSTIFYSHYINDNQKIFVYEPQEKLYNLLVHNIQQNHLGQKIQPFQSGVFCYNGVGKMSATDMECGNATVAKRYAEENYLPCNFGGIGMGNDGETINLITVDSMTHDNIGFIHCDAQGAENFILSGAKETIRKWRPVILYENNAAYDTQFYDRVCNAYPEYTAESRFDVKAFCMEELQYSQCIDRFNDSNDTLLVP